MTNRKAIEWLKLQRDRTIWWNDYSDNTQNIRKEAEKQIKESYEMAIKALEQEPKMVLYSGDGYADGCMAYDMAECPNCGYEYEDGDKDWGLPFCPGCGQSLNWESEGEDADSD